MLLAICRVLVMYQLSGYSAFGFLSPSMEQRGWKL